MIYYVEDDVNIRNLTLYALKQAGLEAVGFEKANDLYEACAEALPQLFLLDIMLPDEDGISILRRLRSQPATAELPVMMMTAKGTEYDVVTGLDSGADDYLIKPFGMLELVSRVNALLRRRAGGQGMEGADDKGMTSGPVTLFSKQHIVTVEEEKVVLTLKEFELLRFLMENPGLVFTREQLLEALWGWSYEGNTRTIDVHIQTLRHKLGVGAVVVETVRGVGYRARK
ncbi:MAG: response regulator transcription factor [Coriobacteriia bacterium]|nr:response regulator transcription factor [Coriobacteriia bacterium]